MSSIKREIDIFKSQSCSVVSLLSKPIHYFYIDHNAPCLPPRILHKNCFQFLLGITVVSREIKNDSYAFFWGGGGSCFLTFLLASPQPAPQTQFNLCQQRLRISAEILVLGYKRTQRITGSTFRISFQPDQQIDNGMLYRPIMGRTQILVLRWGPRTRISSLFRRRTQAEFSFVCGAGYRRHCQILRPLIKLGKHFVLYHCIIYDYSHIFPALTVFTI